MTGETFGRIRIGQKKAEQWKGEDVYICTCLDCFAQRTVRKGTIMTWQKKPSQAVCKKCRPTAETQLSKLWDALEPNERAIVVERFGSFLRSSKRNGVPIKEDEQRALIDLMTSPLLYVEEVGELPPLSYGSYEQYQSPRSEAA